MPSLPPRNSAEPSGLLKILVSAFSGVLFGLFLSNVDTPAKGDGESVRPEDNPGPETTLRPSQVPTTSQIPPTPNQRYYPGRRERHTPLWEKLAGFGTIGLLIVNIFALHAVKKEAKASKSAADTAAQELELSQRPWVSLANISVDGPLVFDSNGAHVTISFSISNTGRSVAVNGFYSVEMMATMAEMPSTVGKRDEMCKFQGERSERVQELKISRFAQTWFPGQPIPMSHTISVDSGQIKSAMVDIPKKIFPDQPAPNFFMPVLVGCIAYRPTFVSAQYHTGYVLDLVHKKIHTAPLFMQHGEVPASDLEFRYDPFYGAYAD